MPGGGCWIGRSTQFLADAVIDFPFCICWANENWTRRWDGKNDEVLISQDHGPTTDASFISDIEPILRHRNYIRIHGRPVLIVYRTRLLSDPVATARRWREHCREAGLGDPYLIAAEVFETIDPREIGFDAVIEFPPNTPGPRNEITREVALANPSFAGLVYRYTDLIELTSRRSRPPYPLFKTVCPGWDNEPRCPGRGNAFAFSSPAAYGRWLDDACRFALGDPDPEQHLVFVNAWNEWAEGAHLEPDRRYGYAYLQETADVIRSLRTPPAAPWSILFVSHDANLGGAQLVLLNAIRWLSTHTSIRIKILCLESGDWLPKFMELADTVLLSELQDRADAASEEDVSDRLLEFCGTRPALIYANSAASGRVYRLLSRLRAPILTHVHELETSLARYAGAWIADIVEHSRHYVACSRAVRDNLVTNHRVTPTAISTVYSSISADPDLSPLADSDMAAERHRLGLSGGTHVVFGSGIGMPFRKGADLFIRVARLVQQAGRNDIHFYWIGEFHRHESDPRFGIWADHAAALQGADSPHVTFLGFRGDPQSLLRTGDVFLLSSREDPFPVAALEAAHCRLPIVCFADAGGMPEFVEDDAGHIVPAGDVEAMAERVVALVDDRVLRRTLGERAREKVVSRYTVEHTAPYILSACRTVAHKKPGVWVIVPNYNHARHLAQRLDSIFNQTYRDIEVIVLDDASSDDSRTVLANYRDRADVRIVVNDHNSGSTFRQWLKEIDLATSDILWIAESDDRCEPDFLETLVPAFENSSVKLAYANSHVIDDDDVVVGDYVATPYLTALSRTKWTQDYQVPAEREINDGLGIKNTILSASSALWRRFEMRADMRATLADLRIAGDWYCHIHAIENGEVHYTAKKLNYHRRHSNSVVGSLLEERRVEGFFREIARVHSVVFSKYRLADDFADKWEQSLREQWRQFCPDFPFDQIAQWYPIDRLREQVVSRSGSVIET